MPTKKEQTVERSQKGKTSTKTATKKTPTQSAKAALDFPGSPEAGIPDAAAPEALATAKTPSRKPVKRAAKKTGPQEQAATAVHAPPVLVEHQSSSPGSEGHFHELSVTADNIAVRAYFIGEHRRAYGIPGNSDEDWLEAERQLIAEASVFGESSRGVPKS